MIHQHARLKVEPCTLRLGLPKAKAKLKASLAKAVNGAKVLGAKAKARSQLLMTSSGHSLLPQEGLGTHGAQASTSRHGQEQLRPQLSPGCWQQQRLHGQEQPQVQPQDLSGPVRPRKSGRLQEDSPQLALRGRNSLRNHCQWPRFRPRCRRQKVLSLSQNFLH